MKEFDGTASIQAETFNLVKNLVSAGILSLPSGVAAFANAPSALIPAAGWIIFLGGIFGYFFHLLGRICGMTMAATYREAWESTVGEAGSLVVALVNMLMAGLGNLSFSIVLADTFHSLFATIELHVSRTESLLIVTVVALLPLCLMKNLQVLAPFSIVGLIGMVFIAVAMAVRYFDGTYTEGGKFWADIPDHLKPSFGSIGAKGALHFNVLVLVCMIFNAYVAHYNAPRFYVELKHSTAQRFGAVVGYSFAVSALFYLFITVFGFLTFGENSSGFILNNYSTKDEIATICRLCIAFSIIFTYPIVFIGVRDGVLDLLLVPHDNHTSWNLNVLTLILLTILTVLASFMNDLGTVNAVGGGTLVTAIVFIFPAVMLFCAVKDLDGRATKGQRQEVVASMCLMCFGIFVGIIGVYLALK